MMGDMSPVNRYLGTCPPEYLLDVERLGKEATSQRVYTFQLPVRLTVGHSRPLGDYHD